MKTLNIILIFVAIIFATNTIEAQVKFKLSYDTEDELYTVSIIPNETFESPDNITGTGQVTIRVPSNYFEPANVTNLHDQMVWHANSRTDSPIEAADFDYVSFGLMNPGVSNPDYKAGEEIQLFSFENAYGCTGGIEIVDNYKDPFMAPNSKSVNIGNSLTIFGAGGEAWAGLVGDGKVNCMTTSTTDLAEITEFSVFPNPVLDFVNVEIYWEQESTDATLKIVDTSGKILKRDYIELKNGANTFQYEANDFSSGVYWIEIEGNDWKLNLDRFFKGK
ncbi:MAG: T9SS type A sorting domain-containing protein [Saprospiraceae bacterium]|jgi:hypothetical protein|nr:T9SS type A sorting domain-containing protein [Saprospiraceae bacterium]